MQIENKVVVLPKTILLITIMAQRNEVILVGRIKDKVKYALSQTGNEYVYFLLDVENQTHASEVAAQYYQTLHVTCFKRPVTKYLKNVEAKGGNIVIVFGYVGSFTNEIKGKYLIQNTIIAKEIFVVKTKA